LSSSESGSTAIATERFNGHLHFDCTPPPGFLGSFILGLDQGQVAVGGRAVEEDELVVLSMGSDMDFVTSGVVDNETLYLPEAEFGRRARALTRSSDRLSAETSELRRGDPRRLRGVRRAIRTGVGGDSFDREAETQLIAEVALWLAEASSPVAVERLANGTATAVARAAREYIEKRFRGQVRLEDLCTHVGVSLRTLQRCFAAYFQVRPTEYLRARRMNEARRILVAADPAADHVTRIAIDVGCTHLGRFAVDYRTFFGESPSQTLAARRPRLRSS
jgi:AraC-like DNA-binding protein